MRCGACPKSAAVPATVSDEPTRRLPLGTDCPGRRHEGDDPRARRPAVANVFLEAWRVSRAWSLVLDIERVPPEMNAADEAVGLAVDSGVTILVCRTCRDSAGSDAEPRPGKLLAAATRNAAARSRHRRRRGRMPRQLQAPALGRAVEIRRLELRVRRPRHRQRRRPRRRRAPVRHVRRRPAALARPAGQFEARPCRPHPASSVANPKFARRWSSAMSEFRIRSHTSNPLNSSVVLDLKFLNADAIQIAGTSNPPH